MYNWKCSDETPACPWAENVKPLVTCESCPFKDCILFLENRDRSMMCISDLIAYAYYHYDKGMALTSIGRVLQVPIYKVSNWIAKKNKLEPLIERFGIRSTINV